MNHDNKVKVKDIHVDFSFQSKFRSPLCATLVSVELWTYADTKSRHSRCRQLNELKRRREERKIEMTKKLSRFCSYYNVSHIFIHEKYFSNVLSSSFTHPEPRVSQIFFFAQSLCRISLHNLLDHNGTSSPFFRLAVKFLT